MTAARSGWAGIALGFLAFFVAVPPLEVRTIAPTVILALFAFAAGSYAVGGKEYRLGWGAIVAGAIGLVGGIAATKSGKGNLEQVVVWGALLASTLRYATPLIFGALGGLFSERSGVINIALEGMMLIGAFFGAWGADVTGSWIGGIVIALADHVGAAGRGDQREDHRQRPRADRERRKGDEERQPAEADADPAQDLRVAHAATGTLLRRRSRIR